MQPSETGAQFSAGTDLIDFIDGGTFPLFRVRFRGFY